MNFYDPDGHLLDYRRVEELASERAHLAADRMLLQPGRGRDGGRPDGRGHAGRRSPAVADMNLPRFLQLIQHRGGKSAGAIRVSLGLVSNFADVERFLQFAAGFRDQSTSAARRRDLRHRVVPRHPRRQLSRRPQTAPDRTNEQRRRQRDDRQHDDRRQ